MNQTDRIDKRVYAAILATGLMSFSGVIVETAMNITFPTLMKEFDITTNMVQWMTSIYLLIVAIIVPLSAILKKSFATKKLFLCANLLFITGALIDALAGSFAFLLMGRAIQGIGTGIALPLMFNIILEQVPQSKIGFMMGLANMITGIAPAIGPTFGGIVVSSFGWRWVFYFLLPLLVISLLLGIWGIEQKSAIERQKIDGISFAGIAMMFSGLIFGFSNLSSGQFLSWQVGGALLFGLIGMIVLIVRSLKIAVPILNLRLFNNQAFAGHVLGFFLTQIISLGFAFLLPNYIQLVNGNSALLAGLLVLPAGFMGAFFGPFGGKLLDQYGPRKPILAGFTSCVISLVLFAAFSRQLSNMFIMLIYILYMGGMGACMGCVMTSALNTLQVKERTQGNAIMNTLQQFAGAMGTSLSATVVAQSQYHLHVGTAKATAIGTQHAFIMLLIFSLIVWLSYFKSVPKEK
ncbi:MFS transporter [Limosilactobacillus mucosae]|uniref:MFS transporter n=2 Tax=Limosilactobacillus mucosae TaxID=97478 RepID=A0AAJ1M8I6_LIMMU|nr:MFS transporter [Limosilactobacillus mucosae]MDD6454948.1 MFS transporter [Lactobacillus sp.]NME33402.1 multidrug efflux MFS transporter [Lactobacillus sp. MRS-253-APC-2B]MDC2829302.1 MFS transporter [Limosilactobacillus mucosae]MDC2836985.1 MFS transporter [Limosilactobacillus mucosae]MDC2849200.1 MFS transporter [Limosilactobacillus mucosae]